MNVVRFSDASRLEGETASRFQNEGFQERALRDLLERRYDNLRLELDARSSTFWCIMQPTGRPCYTYEIMQDFWDMQGLITSSFSGGTCRESTPFSWFVMASAVPGIFNLGGNLGHFAQCIRNRDLEALRHYGQATTRAVHRNTVAFEVPIITMALVQGDALGGGFEHALSFDIIVAERSAKLGLPEILFNMFPGMGAYSFLSRRIGRKGAEEMILSGRIYSAAELFEMGVVDVLAEDGQGVEAAQDYIARHHRKFNAHLGTYRARRRVNSVTLEELFDVVDIWAETAINLTAADLRKMDRLCAAQDRRVAALQSSTPTALAVE
jgi:DSF synthase